MLQLSPGLIDRILVRATGICDVGLTQRHLPPALPPPIEVMRNGPTACLRHERFEANHFGADSLRFGLGEDLVGWQGLRTDMWPSRSSMSVQPGQELSE